jgi:hypothetical protein
VEDTTSSSPLPSYTIQWRILPPPPRRRLYHLVEDTTSSSPWRHFTIQCSIPTPPPSFGYTILWRILLPPPPAVIPSSGGHYLLLPPGGYTIQWRILLPPPPAVIPPSGGHYLLLPPGGYTSQWRIQPLPTPAVPSAVEDTTFSSTSGGYNLLLPVEDITRTSASPLAVIPSSGGYLTISPQNVLPTLVEYKGFARLTPFTKFSYVAIRFGGIRNVFFPVNHPEQDITSSSPSGYNSQRRILRKMI